MVMIALPSLLGQKTDAEADKTEILIPQQNEEQTVPTGVRKPSVNGFCCLAFGLIVLLSGLILSSIYVYKYHFAVQLPQDNLFHCRVLYDEDSVYAPFKSQMQLDEDVEIYLEDEVEMINVPVPQFSGGDPADIIHDFQRRLTAYHDLSLDKCYVIELNTTIVMPPRNLWELLANVKVNQGTYLPQTYIMQEEMVVTEQVRNFYQMGGFINRLCNGKETYRLKRRNIKRTIQKRSLKSCRHIRHLENTFVTETFICEQE
ncbi:integral membrane protein 2C isoform X2 [Callorhinchus milii]|uniref:integral membrane protein 2C isoform X2 n=1 Tax=Callorhinchus milii TaxID=7868 RepID=UPI001C3F9B1D|nr:integral membrane protein 2C isoform X2 [Callorhinchus milii]